MSAHAEAPRRSRDGSCIGAIGLAAIGLVATGIAGCLLTSDFNGVAGSRTDAGDLDASADADGADPNAFPCDPGAHLSCINFDQGPLDKSGWVVQKTGASSKAALDTTIFRSPPDGFHSTIGSAAKAFNVGGILRQTPSLGKFRTLIYAFDMRIHSCESLGMGGSVTLAAFQPSDAVAFGIVLVDTNVYTFAQVDVKAGTFTPTPFSVAPKLDTWARITIRLALSSVAAHVVVMLDDQKVVDAEQVAALPGPNVLLNLGANATGPISGCDVVYDNVTFDTD